MRANSLQELVYKQGQAGVTKATVSIVFDNHDKDRSPVGYDHLDEISLASWWLEEGASTSSMERQQSQRKHADMNV